MRVSETSKRRFDEVARAFDDFVTVALNQSFEQVEPQYKELEKHMLRTMVRTPFERKEVRRIAERLFTEAFADNCPWPIFGRTLRRIHRLGYSNMERRYHVACLYAQWCQRHPDRSPHFKRANRRAYLGLIGVQGRACNMTEKVTILLSENGIEAL